MGRDWGLVARKVAALCLLAAAVSLSVVVSQRMRVYVAELGNTVCIRDTLRVALDSWLLPYTQSPRIINAMMILDALLIDLIIASVGLYWVFTGLTLSWLFALLPFYIVRAVAINTSKWPLPEPYLFYYPGFPSFFVNYEKTNDLYFSGHTGMSVIMMFDAWLNKRFPLFSLCVGLLLLTVTMLFILGAHFLNDIIIGFFVGASTAMLAHKYRFNLTLFVLKGLVAVEEGVLKTAKFFKNSS